MHGNKLHLCNKIPSNVFRLVQVQAGYCAVRFEGARELSAGVYSCRCWQQCDQVSPGSSRVMCCKI